VRSFEVKLDRAFEHLDRFVSERSEWLVEGKAYRVTEERQPASPQQNGYYVKWIDPEPLPHTFAAILGDCLGNFRASLDHLAYELALAHSKTLTAIQTQDSEFPIFGPKSPSAGVLARKIGCVHPNARTRIERLQPHHRRTKFAEHPLWILHRLTVIDKHQTIPVVLASVGSTQISGVPITGSLDLRGGRNIVIPLPNGGMLTLYHGPLEARARVITHEWADPAHYVEMDFDQTFDISFPQWGEVAARERVVDTLTAVGAFIRLEIVERLVEYLD
jgi:hypothetical protein